MEPLTHLDQDLADAGLAHWQSWLRPLLDLRLADSAHGDMVHWQSALADLPAMDAGGMRLDADEVVLCTARFAASEQQQIRSALLRLSPWRKGPFDVGGVHIDSEWRCDMKWRRLRPAIASLEGRRVLDVGCGNGYYALRMRGLRAATVIGVDPTPLYVMQYRALARFLPHVPVHVLPLRLNDLPSRCHAFDTTFSMGVLYHQRAPIEHLCNLRDTLRPAGELVLETLILPGDDPQSRTPPSRYARMRNVWHLPTLTELQVWLARSGFRDCRVIDVTVTSEGEQRTTEWMAFESLGAALQPADPRYTVEGWPAPRRALVIAVAP